MGGLLFAGSDPLAQVTGVQVEGRGGRLGGAEGKAAGLHQLSPALAGGKETGPTDSRAWVTAQGRPHATSKPTLGLSDACPVGDRARRSLEDQTCLGSGKLGPAHRLSVLLARFCKAGQ